MKIEDEVEVYVSRDRIRTVLKVAVEYHGQINDGVEKSVRAQHINKINHYLILDSALSDLRNRVSFIVNHMDMSDVAYESLCSAINSYDQERRNEETYSETGYKSTPYKGP